MSIISGGTVTCWGANFAWQCGRGSYEEALAPGPVPGITGAESIAAGEVTRAFDSPNGTAKCWGKNNGTLGNGTSSYSINTPVDVLNLTALELDRLDSIRLGPDVEHQALGTEAGTPWRPRLQSLESG